MAPVLFRIGGVAIESNGVALYLVIALVVGVYAAWVWRREGWNRDDLVPSLAAGGLGALAGARIHGALLPWDRFTADPVDAILRSGELRFFGGFALGILAGLLYLRWRRYPLPEAANALVPIVPVVYALLRLGCLLNGDDYGKPSDLPWAMTFPRGSPPTTTTPVHPTQIYEILLMIPMFAWLWARRDGCTVVWEMCVLMGAERFAVEFWRVEPPGPAGLTLSQWIALALAGMGIVGWLRGRDAGGRRRAAKPRARPSDRPRGRAAPT